MESNQRTTKLRGVILAAGLGGISLDPLSTPKPIVSIGTTPLTTFSINYLQSLGITNIDIYVNQRSNIVEKSLLGYRGINTYTNIRFITVPFRSITMLETLVYVITNNQGPLLITPCDLVFEKFPIDITDLEGNDPDVWEMFITPSTPESIKTNTRKYFVKHDCSNNLIVEDVGKDLVNANYVDLGISYVGENIIQKYRTKLIEFSMNRNYNEFIMEIYDTNIGKPRIVSTKEWFLVNSVSTRIKAEMFLQENVPTKLGETEQFLEIGQSSELDTDYSFPFVRKKETLITIKNNILHNIGDFQVIPPDLIAAPHFLITDPSLYRIVGKDIEDQFVSRGFIVKTVIVPEGEKSKSIEQFWELTNELFALGIQKQSIILSLGGGVINNIAGLVASTIFRGISLYHIPTTLLAQLDSAIDIKHAINAVKGKNLVGTLYPPDRVIVDPALLPSLPIEHVLNGLSESIKHGLAQDPSLLDYFSEYSDDIQSSEFLGKVIRWTIDLKIQCMGVSGDGGRSEMIKDYGHGLGHALEQYSGYTISHGHAIAVGMCISAEIAKLLGVTTDAVVEEHYRIFSKYRLPATLTPEVNLDDLQLMIEKDKTFILGKSIMGLISKRGVLWNDNSNYAIPVDIEIVREALAINQCKNEKSKNLPVLSSLVIS